MAKLNARKATLEAELGDPAVYQDAEKVRALLADQAYVARELEALENEWLEMNA
jgi:ATP-binding cassette subfamily F protein 3